MDVVVSHLAEQGMVADLILFMKPYNTDDELAFGTQAQDERYVRYILARYAAFPNVIWCISNEWEYTGRDEAYWERIGEIVRNEDPWMAQVMPTVHCQFITRRMASVAANSPFSTTIGPSMPSFDDGVRNGQFPNGDEWANYSIVQNRGNEIPVVNDEYGYIGEPRPHRVSRVSSIAVRYGLSQSGAVMARQVIFGFSMMAPIGQSARVIMTGHWHDAEEYDDIDHLVDFLDDARDSILAHGASE